MRMILLSKFIQNVPMYMSMMKELNLILLESLKKCINVQINVIKLLNMHGLEMKLW